MDFWILMKEKNQPIISIYKKEEKSQRRSPTPFPRKEKRVMKFATYVFMFKTFFLINVRSIGRMVSNQRSVGHVNGLQTEGRRV